MVPGDIDIRNCILVTPRGGIVDVTQKVYSFAVYQTIWHAGIMCELKFYDLENYISIVELAGDEMVFLRFAIAGGLEVSYKFGIAKLERLKSATNTTHASLYTLQCVSLEALQAKTNFVQRSFNETISSIIEKIHKQYLKSEKPFVAEQTKGKQKIVIANYNPYEAIDMVRKRAVSANSNHPSSAFVYFETINEQGNQAYRFQTIESLFEGPTIREFVELQIGSDITQADVFKTIIKHEITTSLNTIDHIRYGSKTRIGKLDMRTMDYTFADYSNFIPFKTGGTKTYETPLFNELYSDQVKIPPSVVVPYDSTDRPDTGISEMLYPQQNYISSLLQNKLELTVYGDTTLKAGDIINVKLRKKQDTTGSVQYDPLFSGNWLVMSINHKYIGPGNTPRYICVMDLIKGGLQ